MKPKPISAATPLSARLLASRATPALSASVRRSPWAASSNPNRRRPAINGSFRWKGFLFHTSYLPDRDMGRRFSRRQLVLVLGTCLREPLLQQAQDLRRHIELQRLSMAKIRHLFPSLRENARQLRRLGLGHERRQIVLQEDDADDILKQLRLWIELKPLFAHERSYPVNVASTVASFSHDVGESPCMKLLGVLSPPEIAGAPFRITL